jgi:hypothetical protein
MSSPQARGFTVASVQDRYLETRKNLNGIETIISDDKGKWTVELIGGGSVTGAERKK